MGFLEGGCRVPRQQQQRRGVEEEEEVTWFNVCHLTSSCEATVAAMPPAQPAAALGPVADAGNRRRHGSGSNLFLLLLFLVHREGSFIVKKIQIVVSWATCATDVVASQYGSDSLCLSLCARKVGLGKTSRTAVAERQVRS